MIKNSCIRSIKQFYTKYKDIILFNKSIVIASTITAISDVYIVSLAAGLFSGNYIFIATISLVADFLVYNVSFLILFFVDNKNKYINSDGTKNKKKIKEDSKKLLTTLGISEISYLTTKFLSVFVIFEITEIDPYLISIITTIMSWVSYIIIANLMVKKNKLFH